MSYAYIVISLSISPIYFLLLCVQWLFDIFLNTLEYRNGNILLYTENKLLGPPRLSQVRVGNVTCEISEFFPGHFNTCYPYYGDRHQSGNVGISSGSGSSVEGRMATYKVGIVFDLFTFNNDANRRLVDGLRNESWINRATRAVIIEFSIYNANLDMLCFVQ